VMLKYSFAGLLMDAGRPPVDFDNAEQAEISFTAYWNNAWGLTDAVHAALDPPSGDGPFFQRQGSEYVLESPTDEAAAIGFLENIEPREDGYELVFSEDDGACLHSSGAYAGWPAASGRPNATRVPARAGYSTLVYAHCKATDAGTANAGVQTP
jgi:hypothetical protein